MNQINVQYILTIPLKVKITQMIAYHAEKVSIVQMRVLVNFIIIKKSIFVQRDTSVPKALKQSFLVQLVPILINLTSDLEHQKLLIAQLALSTSCAEEEEKEFYVRMAPIVLVGTVCLYSAQLDSTANRKDKLSKNQNAQKAIIALLELQIQSNVMRLLVKSVKQDRQLGLTHCTMSMDVVQVNTLAMVNVLPARLDSYAQAQLLKGSPCT
jgi:hypothetical protein